MHLFWKDESSAERGFQAPDSNYRQTFLECVLTRIAALSPSNPVQRLLFTCVHAYNPKIHKVLSQSTTDCTWLQEISSIMRHRLALRLRLLVCPWLRAIWVFPCEHYFDSVRYFSACSRAHLWPHFLFPCRHWLVGNSGGRWQTWHWQ